MVKQDISLTISSFLTFTFHKVVWRRIWGVVGYLVVTSLHVYCWVC